MFSNHLRLISLFVFILVASAARPSDEDVRIAIVEPLSGPSASVGEWWRNHVRTAVERVNASGGVLGGRRVQLVEFDSKSNPQEAIVVLKTLEDQGIRFVFGTAGSNVGISISDAIAKHNTRNPDDRLLFLNYGSLASEMTNELCNFWHFRFGPNADMQVLGMLRYLTQEKTIRSIYLLNQDYAYGQAVQKLEREVLARERPDVRIAVDELIPLQKTKDFAPYIAKMRSSGADAVLTSTWGPDLNLLVKAGQDFGLGAKIYTLNAHFIGAPTAIGESGAGRVVNISTWHANIEGAPLLDYAVDFRRRFKSDWNYLPAKAAVEMWAKAVNTAGSLDAAKVAKALEGMKHDAGTGTAWMRPDDHQITMPLFVAAFDKIGGAVRNPAEGTDYGFRTVLKVDGAAATLAPRCKMERP